MHFNDLEGHDVFFTSRVKPTIFENLRPYSRNVTVPPQSLPNVTQTCSGFIILSLVVECCCIHLVSNVKFSLFISSPQLLGRTHDVFWVYRVAILLMNFVFLNYI